MGKGQDMCQLKHTAREDQQGERLTITAAIEAFRGRQVVTLDIPGSSLHAELDEDIIML
jgi:hypothetical protein